MDAVPAHVHVVALLAVDDVHAVAPVDVDVVLAVLDVDAVEAYVGRAVALARRVGIAGAIGVIAEIDPAALEKRFKQGWISEKITDLDACIERIKQARAGGRGAAA